MKILAVEFSSAQRSVAVWDDGASAAPVLLGSALEPPLPRLSNAKCKMQNAKSASLEPCSVGPPARTQERSVRPLARSQECSVGPLARTQRSLGLVEAALAEANCRREEIGALAVGLGPGSYNGIRGAIALAQGWQLGRGIGLLGISSVECLAAQARADGPRGAVYIIIDAQRTEFYLARYQIADTDCRETGPLRLASKSEIQALAAGGQTLLGPDIARWFPAAKDLYPSAAILGRLACGRREFVNGETLEPIYLRETAFKKAPPPRLNP